MNLLTPKLILFVLNFAGFNFAIFAIVKKSQNYSRVNEKPREINTREIKYP